MPSSKHSTFEVRSYLTGARVDVADSYLDAATKAGKLADAEQAAYVVVEVVTRCTFTPTRGIKPR